MDDVRDVLDYIKWGELCLLRIEMQEDDKWPWPFIEEGPREMLCMVPGDVEPFHETDQYLPEYVGLLDAQLYWPALGPL